MMKTRLHRSYNYPYQNISEDVELERYIDTVSGKEIVITMNNEMYILTIVASTGMCKMSYPARETEFYIDNIYIENPELPILKEGRLAQYLTEQVKKKLGLDLPKVPYLPGLKLTPKR